MKKILILVLTVLVGFSAGVFVKLPEKTYIEKTKCSDNYDFINKQLDCAQKDAISKKEYTAHVNNLNLFIDSSVKSGNASTVSVYFRDLYQGPTFGINRDDRFIPASLLKLPLLMGLYNLAESNPEILNEKIEYQPVETAVVQKLVEIPPLKIGSMYFVEELIERMIIYSDNEAYNILQVWVASKNPTSDIFVSTLTELGLSYPRNSVDSTFTVKSYSALFRQLFNSSYLSFKHSEKVLEILSRSKFKDGLAKEIPENVRIAHKFGVRDGLAKGLVELHDCGIVYYPNNPYVLCVMTRGDNIDELKKIISTISSMTYKEVESRKL